MKGFALSVFAALLACTIAVPSVLRYAVDREVSQEAVRLQKYQFWNCMPAAKEIGVVSSLTFSPDPLVFPGPLQVAFDINMKSLIDAPLKGALYMGKKVGNSWVKIPCVGVIGSCSYDDVCQLLSMIGQCPDSFVSAGVPCQCPFKKGTYKLPTTSFDVPIALFPAGDYHMQGNLTYNNQPVGCYEILASFG